MIKDTMEEGGTSERKHEIKTQYVKDFIIETIKTPNVKERIKHRTTA